MGVDMALLLGLLYIALFIVIYFLPSIVASRRQHNNFIAIFILNLFLGFTLLGWVGALVWAVYKSEPAKPTTKKKK